MRLKKGDLVKVRRLKGAGIIQAIQTSREVSGPNGDFHVTRHYRVLLNGKIWRIHEASLILVSSCDIS
tara:strand:+ start:350 stop:553 length:204 start_codon:yes stop_codon:yes gene_type:complete